METIPVPSSSITLRLGMDNQIGMFGKIAMAIGETGGDVGEVDIERIGKGTAVRDFSINARDESHEKELVDAVKTTRGVRIIDISDRTFLLHYSGKIEIHNKVPEKIRTAMEVFTAFFFQI